MKILCVFLLFLVLLPYLSKCSLPETIKIGAILEPGQEDMELAFKHAIWLNDKLITSRLIGQVEYVESTDSLGAAQAACRLLDSGVWAIIHPYMGTNAWALKSIADRTGMPNLQTALDFPSPEKLFEHSLYASNFTITLYPDISTLNKAIFDYVVYNYAWRSFSLLFDTNENLIKIKDALAMTTIKNTLQIKVREYRFSKVDPPEKLFKSIMKKRDSNFIISLDRANYDSMLFKLKKFSLMDFYYSYLFHDLDLHFWNISDPDLAGFNVTGFRMFDPFDERIKVIYNAQGWKTGRYEPGEDVKLTLDLALIYDAVSLFTRSIISLNDLTDQISGPSISCRRENTWHFGKSIVNQMKKLGVPGITGRLVFNQEGKRDKVDLEMVRHSNGEWSKIGNWNPDDGIQITTGVQAEVQSAIEYLKSTKLKLIVAESVPYIMKKPDYANLTGDEFDKYDGFCIDLLRQIHENLNISGYELTVFTGKGYGSPDKKNGTWTGLLGEMLEKNHDLATTDLTITHERQTAVDFTIPFITLGISILYSKPQAPPLNLWAFLDPFSLEVWFYVATAFIGVSLLMYIVARVSPYEWLNTHPCDEEPEMLSNQFSLGNCLWFTLGSIMQQGSDLAPKSLSTRLMASGWSFFTLIMVSSYTANLAAFLTVARMENPINNAEDLAMQTKVAYGCSKAGSTRKFFQNSTYTIYQRMYAQMESAEPPVYTEGNSDGVRRVLKGNYAFLMESLSILYNVNRYCNLTQVGELLDQKGYGIAMRPGSPFRTIFSNEILRLQEQGKINALRKKWFEQYPMEVRARENPEEAECPITVAQTSTSALDVANVGGVFIVLFAGIAISYMFVMIEFVWKAKKVPRHERHHTCKMMSKEIWHICKGQSSNRSGWRKKSTSDGTHSMSTDTVSRVNRINEPSTPTTP